MSRESLFVEALAQADERFFVLRTKADKAYSKTCADADAEVDQAQARARQAKLRAGTDYETVIQQGLTRHRADYDTAVQQSGEPNQVPAYRRPETRKR